MDRNSTSGHAGRKANASRRRRHVGPGRVARSVGRSSTDHRSILLALRRLHDLSKAINSSLDVEEVESVVLQQAAQLMHADRVVLLLLDRVNDTLSVHRSLGIDEARLQRRAFTGIRSFDHCIVRKGAVITLPEILSPEDLACCRTHVPELLHMFFAPLEIQGEAYGLLGVSGAAHAMSLVELGIFCSLASQAAAAMEHALVYRKLHETFLHTTEALAEAINSRDAYTGGHTRRVRQYALVIADALGLADGRRATLEMAAVLHDIGKIGINDAILRKRGGLTDEELAAMDGHAEIGARILRHIDELRAVVPGVRHHHERFDGTGYPDGLAGDAIPLEARIIAVADVFDALTTDRPYRRGLSAAQALAKMCGGKGTHFDPDILDVFFTAMSARQEALEVGASQ